MLDKIKTVIKKVLIRVQNTIGTTKDIKADSPKSSDLKVDLEKQSSPENLRMLENADLLNSLEKITSDDFCVLKMSDTLAEALSLVLLQSASDIIIVDNDSKFFGIISSLAILTEVTPQLKDVPVRYRIKLPKMRKRLSEFIVNTVKKPLFDVFNLNRTFCYFQKQGMIIYALEELAKPYRTSDNQEIIPILNDDRTVAGVVSCKKILEYIKSEPCFEARVEELFSKVYSIKKLYTLLPEKNLEDAYFAMEHLPIEYILICEAEQKLLGMVERHQVNTFSHPMYYHLMDMPLEEMMKPVSELYVVTPNQTIKDVISRFIESDTEAAVVVDALGSKVPIGIITPTNLLQFVVHNIRSSIK